jgi:hypothetical protein
MFIDEMAFDEGLDEGSVDILYVVEMSEDKI